MKTETALDRAKNKKSVEVREARAPYRVGVPEWDGYVSGVLEWLAR